MRAAVGRPAVLAARVGGTAATARVLLRRWVLDLPGAVRRSLAPKSVTAPVAMGRAEKIGGVPALAAVFAVLTGRVGALSGSFLFDAPGLGTGPSGWMARGFALGTAAHGIGAARVLRIRLVARLS